MGFDTFASRVALLDLDIGGIPVPDGSLVGDSGTIIGYSTGPDVIEPVTVVGLPPGYTLRSDTLTAAPNAGGVATLALPSTPWVTPIGVFNGIGGHVLDLDVPATGLLGGEHLTFLSPLASFMWDAIPESTRSRDDESVGGNLKQLVTVLSHGLVDVRDEADQFVTLVDVDTCPLDQLSRLSALLGFDFPFDLPEAQQRGFVRSAVSLYRLKGTPAALTFAVTRVIGSGFALAITNEDHVAKTFDVQLTAVQDAASLAQLENKVLYLVNLYAPAGLIPNLVTVYYYHDVAPSVQRVDTNVSTKQFDAWRFNMKKHTFNTIQADGDVVSFNNRGTTALSI